MNRVNNNLQRNNRNNNNVIRRNNRTNRRGNQVRIRRGRGMRGLRGRFRVRNNRNFNNNDDRKKNQPQIKAPSVIEAPRISNIRFKSRFRNVNIRARNNNKSIIDLLLNPYKMVLEARYFSVFPSQIKVIKASVYMVWHFNTAFRRILWFPYGLGFDSLKNKFNVRTTEYNSPVGKALTNGYSNLFWIEDVNDGSFVTHTVPCSSIDGKYRIIGSSMKISNVSSLASKGGSIFISKSDSDKGYPGYVRDDSPKSVMNAPAHNNDRDIMSALHDNYDNSAIKRLYAATEYPIINEVNIHDGNSIFSSYNEYLGATYFEADETIDEQLERISVIQENTTGNNIKYFIQLQSSSPQSYIVETWTVFEIVPDPNSSGGLVTMAQDSFKGASNRIKQLIFKSDCLTKAPSN